MAKSFGIASFTLDIVNANIPIPIYNPSLAQIISLDRFVQSFRIASKTTNAGLIHVGRSNMNLAGNFSGETLTAGQAFSYDLNPKVASFEGEFDLLNIFVMGTVATDQFLLTVISKVN